MRHITRPLVVTLIILKIPRVVKIHILNIIIRPFNMIIFIFVSLGLFIKKALLVLYQSLRTKDDFYLRKMSIKLSVDTDCIILFWWSWSHIIITSLGVNLRHIKNSYASMCLSYIEKVIIVPLEKFVKDLFTILILIKNPLALFLFPMIFRFNHALLQIYNIL